MAAKHDREFYQDRLKLAHADVEIPRLTQKCTGRRSTFKEPFTLALIKTKKDAKKTLTTQRFSVKRKGNEQLIRKAIELCVIHSSWENHGGKGRISISKPGIFVVKQGQPAMRKVEQFMRDLNAYR